MHSSLKRLLIAAATIVVLLVPGAASAVSTSIVIGQIYGGGGNSGAVYTNDYIELFNRGTTTVSLSDWSVQYTSAAGSGNFGSATNLITPLSGSLAPGQYLLVQEASNAAVGSPLPAPDVTDATPVNMAAGAGKVALVNTTTPLGCNGGSTPCSPAALATIVDLVGYGTGASGANFFEGTGPAPTVSATLADFRGSAGCSETNDNAADFAAATPSARNTASQIHDCSADAAPSIVSRSPAGGATDVSLAANVTIEFSEPVTVTGRWFSLACETSGSHTASVSGGPTLFTLDPDTDVVQGETCTVTVFASQVSDQDTTDPPDTMTADDAWSFGTQVPPTPIHAIQGASHSSPLAGQALATTGIVTATRTNGFYLQDPSPDADPATSEGVFVFTSSAPSVAVGDAVRVGARAQEFRPGGASSANLTTTELTSPSVTVLSTGNPLPPPTIVGSGGRVPPDTIIEDDATGDVETSGVFDPENDGLDFWESLEGMRVQLNNAVAVGPTNPFGETWVVGDDGANASVRTPRGGVLLRPNDGNPERVVVDDVITPMPNVNVGDHYDGPIVGVLDYDFGNFFVEVTSPVDAIHDGVTREATSPQGANQLAVATFNVENLAPGDPQSKFDQLADLIVNHLAAPDVIAVEEIQDNNGAATNDGTVDASLTWAKLIAAIDAIGPTYDYRQIDPVNNQDGGAPGGNIRQGFLFRTDRGLSFVDRPGGSSTNGTSVVDDAGNPELTFSPGRIDPSDAAWNTSRKPLAGEFMFRGHHLFVIANHFNSKGGDDPLLGHLQPPTRSSEVQRHRQARVENDFIDSILAIDPNAGVVTAGDFNDFEFSDTIHILEGRPAPVLHDLMETLPFNERYSYEFEGNAQVLDHVLLSDALFARPLLFDPVHVNAEFADQASDHDPSVVRIALDAAPTVSAGGPYTVAEGGSVTLTATGRDAEDGNLSYAWDLDGDGSFETSGQSVSFFADDGPASPTVEVQVTDSAGQTGTDSVTVSVTNAAPTGTFHAPSTVSAGSSFTLSLTSPADPSSADTAAGFEYAFDCGDGSGYGAFAASSSRSCPTSTTGTRTVHGRIKDKNGDVTTYGGTVQVTVTFASLCELTRTLVTRAAVAQSLCDKLVAAAAADAAGDAKKRKNKLAAYRKQIDAQAGKSITGANAALLKQLSLEL